MDTTHATPPIRLWFDWLLLVVALAVLCIPAYLAIDAAFGRDGTILYWLLVAYDYPNGEPAATVVGLASIAAALFLVWLSLRLLARFGFAPWRAFALVSLTGLLTLTALVALLASPLLTNGSSLLPILVMFGASLLTVALILCVLAPAGGLAACTAGATHYSDPRAPRVIWRAGARRRRTPAPAHRDSDRSGHRRASNHLLASRERRSWRTPLSTGLGGSAQRLPPVVLFRCDTSGVWCQKLDTLYLNGNGQSVTGDLRYDKSTHLVIATDGTQTILTYPAGDLFSGP